MTTIATRATAVASRVAALLGGAMLVAACHAPVTTAATRAASADSIVLERTRCFGLCPAYRLSLHADGRAVFRQTGDVGAAVDDPNALSPAQFSWLIDRATQIGFASLPSVIMSDSSLCPARATDHPTATVAIFAADSMRRVVDYLGCYTDTGRSVAPTVAGLRHFERQIDSVSRSDRWIRRASGR